MAAHPLSVWAGALVILSLLGAAPVRAQQGKGPFETMVEQVWCPGEDATVRPLSDMCCGIVLDACALAPGSAACSPMVATVAVAACTTQLAAVCPVINCGQVDCPPQRRRSTGCLRCAQKVSCPVDLCAGEQCAGFPAANCSINRCDTCSIEWSLAGQPVACATVAASTPAPGSTRPALDPVLGAPCQNASECAQQAPAKPPGTYVCQPIVPSFYRVNPTDGLCCAPLGPSCAACAPDEEYAVDGFGCQVCTCVKKDCPSLAGEPARCVLSRCSAGFRCKASHYGLGLEVCCPVTGFQSTTPTTTPQVVTSPVTPCVGCQATYAACTADANCTTFFACLRACRFQCAQECEDILQPAPTIPALAAQVAVCEQQHCQQPADCKAVTCAVESLECAALSSCGMVVACLQNVAGSGMAVVDCLRLVADDPTRDAALALVRCETHCDADPCASRQSQSECGLGCQWEPACLPRIDSCLALDAAGCQTAMGCAWDPLRTQCRATGHRCLDNAGDRVRCEADPTCAWSPRCESAAQNDGFNCVFGQCDAAFGACAAAPGCRAALDCVLKTFDRPYVLGQPLSYSCDLPCLLGCQANATSAETQLLGNYLACAAPCLDALDCEGVGQEGQCLAVAGGKCSWHGSCNPAFKATCEQHLSSTLCLADSSCLWSYANRRCLQRDSLCHAVTVDSVCDMSSGCKWDETCTAFGQADPSAGCYAFCGADLMACSADAACDTALQCVLGQANCGTACALACAPSTARASSRQLFNTLMTCFFGCSNANTCPFLDCPAACAASTCVASGSTTTPSPSRTIHLCGFVPGGSCGFANTTVCAPAKLGACEPMQHPLLAAFSLSVLYTQTTPNALNPQHYDVSLHSTADCTGALFGFSGIGLAGLQDQECRPLTAPVIGTLLDFAVYEGVCPLCTACQPCGAPAPMCAEGCLDCEIVPRSCDVCPSAVCLRKSPSVTLCEYPLPNCAGTPTCTEVFLQGAGGTAPCMSGRRVVQAEAKYILQIFAFPNCTAVREQSRKLAAGECALASDQMRSRAITLPSTTTTPRSCVSCPAVAPSCSSQCKQCSVSAATCATCAIAVCGDEAICPNRCSPECPEVELNGVCQCGLGRQCPGDACAGASCKAYPLATCNMSTCGDCLPVWTDVSAGGAALEVDCNATDGCQVDADCSPGSVCVGCNGPKACVVGLVAGQQCDRGCDRCSPNLGCTKKIDVVGMGTTEEVCCRHAGCSSCPAGFAPRGDSQGCPVCLTTGLGGACTECACDPLPCRGGDLFELDDGTTLDCTICPLGGFCDTTQRVCCRNKQLQCSQPRDPGQSCVPVAETRFAFDTATGSCLSFSYGGCGGNSNNFAALASCQAACIPGCTILDCGECEPITHPDRCPTCPLSCSTTKTTTTTTTTVRRSTTTRATVYTRARVLVTNVPTLADFDQLAFIRAWNQVLDPLASNLAVEVLTVGSRRRDIDATATLRVASRDTDSAQIKSRITSALAGSQFASALRAADSRGVFSNSQLSLVGVPETSTDATRAPPPSPPSGTNADSDDGDDSTLLIIVVAVAAAVVLAAVVVLVVVLRRRKNGSAELSPVDDAPLVTTFANPTFDEPAGAEHQRQRMPQAQASGASEA